jgi:hypothetical protein
MVGSSEYPCSAGAKVCNHSIELLVCVGNRICQGDEILSQMTNRNVISLTNDTVDATDQMMFHVV